MRKESIWFSAPSELSQNDPLDGIPNAGTDNTQQEIRVLLRSKFWLLRFPAHLESIFLDQYISRAIKSFHSRAPLLFFLLAIENIGIYHVMPKEQYQHFYSLSVLNLGVIITAFALSYVHVLRPWYEWYIGAGGIIVIANSTISANMGVGESIILTYAGINYIIIVIYSFIYLRFQFAIVVGWLGGLVGIYLAYDLEQHINWKLYNLNFTMTSMLGMCIAYALERAERTSFLQAHLLKNSVDNERKLSQILNTLSRQDGLTGLANRRHLDEVMSHEWNRALRQHQPLVVMMIDVDFFKLYNDQFGHVAGDECLQRIANLMSSLTQRSGELAARYGGEEFILLFPGMNETSAKKQAEKLLNGLAQLKISSPDKTHPFVTISIGIGIINPNKTMCVGDLLRQADAALYKAKANGRNRYEFFDASMRRD